MAEGRDTTAIKLVHTDLPLDDIGPLPRKVLIAWDWVLYSGETGLEFFQSPEVSGLVKLCVNVMTDEASAQLAQVLAKITYDDLRIIIE